MLCQNSVVFTFQISVKCEHIAASVSMTVTEKKTYNYYKGRILYIRICFLYSVNLTEYVAMDPRVCVCLCVCVCVCLCESSLQPKRMDQF